LVPGVAATFAVAELDGSATKKIRLLRMAVSGTKAASMTVQDVRLTKLSTISTGGTATTGIAVPFDSANPAATAVFRGFTVAPTGGGTVIGAIASAKLVLDVITTLMPMELLVWDFSALPASSRPTLHTAAEAFALDYNGGTPPSGAATIDVYTWWTEEPLNA
jgi:hypothetical protein